MPTFEEEEDKHRSDDDLVSSSGYKIPFEPYYAQGVLFSLSLSASSNGLITLTHVDWGSITQVLLVVESTLPTESIAQ